MELIPIDEKHFRSLRFPSRICQKKSVCLDPDYNWLRRGHYNHHYKLKYVDEVVEYFQHPGAISKAQEILRPDNWEYFNCLVAGFRNNVLDTDAHKKTGGPEISLQDRNNTLSPEYYASLDPMTDDEILKFNFDNPVDFHPEMIKHGSHRAYAMIGRLIRGEKYVPFYIDSKNYNPTIKLNHLEILDKLGIPRNEYTICQSSMLAMMYGRNNDDLDIVVSSRLRKESLEGEIRGCKIHTHIDIFGKDHGKFRAFGCKDDDDLINNYSVNIGGYNFVEPRFYFSRIWPVNQKKIKDQEDIRAFHRSDLRHLGPWKTITDEQWGFDLLPTEKNEQKWKELVSV